MSPNGVNGLSRLHKAGLALVAALTLGFWTGSYVAGWSLRAHEANTDAHGGVLDSISDVKRLLRQMACEQNNIRPTVCTTWHQRGMPADAFFRVSEEP